MIQLLFRFDFNKMMFSMIFLIKLCFFILMRVNFDKYNDKYVSLQYENIRIKS